MNVEVIKKLDGRINRKTGLKITSRLRVTAYARVSTGDEEQINSYESQKQYYKEKISNNPNWTYVGIYADEAISGTLDYKRTDFMRMIQDALNHKFDMILTKSISRFARNTLDTLKYVRKLKEQNIAVFFEEENINTLEMAGELLLTILSSVAQQESETISSHVKLGLKMKKERGELIGFNNCLGYKYDTKTKKLEIDENEAEIVKFIFDKYCEGYGAESIAKLLTEMNIKTPKGKEKWHDSTIRGILRNEKYKGDVLQGKTFTLDPISHKRLINLGEEDKYYMTDHHQAIIPTEQFDLVQEIIKERCGARATGRRLGNVGKKYPMSNRIRCGFCGDVLTRRQVYVGKNTKLPEWICIQSAKHGKENCPNSKLIREEMIEEAFVDCYKLLCNSKEFNVDKFLNNMKDVLLDNTPKGKIEILEKQKRELKNKGSRLIELLINKTITEEEYQQKAEEYSSKVQKLDSKIEQLQLLVEDSASISKGISKFKELIQNNNIIEEFDSEIFDALVDYIIIGGYDEHGNKDEFLIRFILKKSFNLTPKRDIDRKAIVCNNRLDNENGLVILDFFNNRSFKTFDRDETGKIRRSIKKGLRIRVEYDIN